MELSKQLLDANKKLMKTRLKYKYQRYLMSYTWKEKRNAVMRRANYVCEACGNDIASEVHHLQYPKRWGDEPLDWLQAVCKPCHKGAHERS